EPLAKVNLTDLSPYLDESKYGDRSVRLTLASGSSLYRASSFSPIKLPRCACLSDLPVTYQPAHRSFNGVHCVMSRTSSRVLSSPVLSVGTLRTKWPGTPSERWPPWQEIQSALRVNFGFRTFSCSRK